MRSILMPGLLGFITGMLLRWAGLCRPRVLQDALALRSSHGLRSALYALGAATALTALLCWLAVIDVDDIVVLPLSAGALAGGAVFGIAAALAGYTPLTAFAGLGGGRFLEALCTIAGCLLGTMLLPLLEAPLDILHTAPPQINATLFRVTLDENYLLGGGFLGLGCLGLLVMVIAACIPSHRKVKATVHAANNAQLPRPVASGGFRIPRVQPRLPAPPPRLRLPPPASPEGISADETFVAVLPGEEALVVDTTADEAP